LKVAIYARVSTEEQTDLNQTIILEQWAKDRDFEVMGIYKDVGTAWKADQSDQKELRRLLDDCSRGKVKQVLVYDLSRLTRQGPLELMTRLKKFSDFGVQVNSYLETWFNVSNDFQPVLVAMFGYFAELYSKQLSARTKAGMQRAKSQGKHCGRPKKKGVVKIGAPLCA
jgi:putative DNA-invertase from lambdoid prophage Rac